MTGRPFRCRSPSSTGHRPQRHPTCAWLQLAKQFEPLTRNFQTRISDHTGYISGRAGYGCRQSSGNGIAYDADDGDLVGCCGEPLGNERANREDQVRSRSDDMGGKLRVDVRLTIRRVAFDPRDYVLPHSRADAALRTEHANIRRDRLCSESKLGLSNGISLHDTACRPDFVRALERRQGGRGPPRNLVVSLLAAHFHER